MKVYLLAALLTAATLSCSRSQQTSEEPAASDTTAPLHTERTPSPLASDSDSLKVDAVTSATHVANSPTFNGQMMISPDRQATVTSTMGGQIHQLLVLPGKAVKQGQLIALLDNPELIELQQTYFESSAQLEYLDAEYQRQLSLGRQEAASQKRVQQCKADFLSMRSKMLAAATRLKALGIDAASLNPTEMMAYLPVKAPISGYVTDLQVNLGKYVETGDPICNIIDKHKPLLQLTVYEKDLHFMKEGCVVDFRINGMGKKTFSATVISIDQAVNRSDYSIKVYARLNEYNADFRPGMYVRAKVRK